MGVVWIVVGIGIVGAFATRIMWRHGRRWESDLGFVSQQWIAEHRLSDMSDPQR